MDYNKNPFSLSFGRIPPEYIVRSQIIDYVYETFTLDPVTTQNFIITGVRGSGKTVTMTAICEQFKNLSDWTIIKISPLDDILDTLLKSLKKILKAKDPTITFGSAYLNVSIKEQEQSINSEIDELLEKFEKKHMHILITIDEITDTPQMRKFSSSLQLFITNNRPIYFIGTGLFEEFEKLKNISNLTFLYRTPKLIMEPLNIVAMAQTYQRIFHIPGKQALRMASMTKGYSYAFQVLGYLYWEEPGEPGEPGEFPTKRLLNRFDAQLADATYNKLWSNLSETDQRVVKCITDNEGGKTKDIAAASEMDSNKFNQYRRRLKEQGIIDVSQYGKISFALPRFKEFVKLYSSS